MFFCTFEYIGLFVTPPQAHPCLKAAQPRALVFCHVSIEGFSQTTWTLSECSELQSCLFYMQSCRPSGYWIATVCVQSLQSCGAKAAGIRRWSCSDQGQTIQKLGQGPAEGVVDLSLFLVVISEDDITLSFSAYRVVWVCSIQSKDCNYCIFG
jgi:hypothetical protein